MRHLAAEWLTGMPWTKVMCATHSHVIIIKQLKNSSLIRCEDTFSAPTPTQIILISTRKIWPAYKTTTYNAYIITEQAAMMPGHTVTLCDQDHDPACIAPDCNDMMVAPCYSICKGGGTVDSCPCDVNL